MKSNLTYFLPTFYLCVCVFVLSHVWLFETLWTEAHQAPLSMEFSRQQYWNGLQLATAGDLPDPEIKPVSLFILEM